MLIGVQRLNSGPCTRELYRLHYFPYIYHTHIYATHIFKENIFTYIWQWKTGLFKNHSIFFNLKNNVSKLRIGTFWHAVFYTPSVIFLNAVSWAPSCENGIRENEAVKHQDWNSLQKDSSLGSGLLTRKGTSNTACSQRCLVQMHPTG